jgi:Patatin-like phospholipase
MAPDRSATGGTSSPSTAFLSLSRVLEEEFVALHGPLPGGPRGEDDGERLPALYEAIHALPEKRAALCLSGGGIRSATFALGVLQGLARAGLLTQFHYLSTVSGGGYIGAWLSAWIHRERDDLQKVAGELASLRPRSKLDPEPPPISHLREFSNYLSPRAGLMSTDAWTLLGTILRNMILIWLVLVPLLAAALVLPRLYVSLLVAVNALTGATAPIVLLCIGAVLLAWAVAYIAATIPSSTTARRGQGTFLVLCLVPLGLGLGALTIYWAAEAGRAARLGASPAPGFWWFVWFGTAVHLLAWAGYTGWFLTTWGQRKPREGSPGAKLVGFVAELIGVVVAGGVGGAIAWVLATTLFSRLSLSLILYAALAPGVLVGAFLLAATVLVGLLSRWTEDEDREWWARCGAWFLIAGSAWTVLGALVLFGPVLLSRTWLSQGLAAVGGVSGLVTVVGGWFTKLTSRDKGSTRVSRADRLMALVVPLAAVVFAGVLMIGLSTLTSGVLRSLVGATGGTVKGPEHWGPGHWGSWPLGPFDHAGILVSSQILLVVGVAVILAVLGLVVAWFVNTNRFSLHAMYRNRLIRAYLGASNPDRRANPFTGFDDNDNLQLHELWPRSSAAPAGAPAPRRKLLHVVNMALNLVHGERLAWQERKAHTFTASALHAGSLVVGYRRTRAAAGGRRDHYGGREGMSLGTAITISGAAASPNMGYHSSPLVTFLMTLFNVRLGWWLGNPGVRGDRTFYLASPRLAVRPIVAEAFGLTGSTGPYVYLSDGGHFENLGLYEMVLRRCHFIVVSDASCDEGGVFQDLGSAVRKIRADMGVPIDFEDGIGILSRSADPARRASSLYWALGRIRYSLADPPATPTADPTSRDGWLLYVKPAFCGTEPPDVCEYAMAHDRFPHEPTTDQFFSESQFESYRMLGSHVMQQMSRDWKGGSLAEFIAHVSARLPRAGTPG